MDSLSPERMAIFLCGKSSVSAEFFRREDHQGKKSCESISQAPPEGREKRQFGRVSDASRKAVGNGQKKYTLETPELLL